MSLPPQSAPLDPVDLLSPLRFDIAAKLPYARARIARRSCGFERELYVEHLRILNGFDERGDPHKKGADRFLESFDRIIESLRKNGFDPNLSRVPVDARGRLLNGAHRVAACIALGLPVVTEISPDAPGQLDISWRYLKGRTRYDPLGLGTVWSDAMAVEYAGTRRSCRLAVAFPSAPGVADVLREEIGLDRIVCESGMVLDETGLAQLVAELYAGEPWLGDPADQGSGAREKARLCLGAGGCCHWMLFEPREDPRGIKERVRSGFGVGKHSVHATDTGEETLRLARVLFNANGRRWLQQSRPLPASSAFRRLLAEAAPFRERPDVVLTGATVLAAFGLRDTRDLDALHAPDKPPPPGLQSHLSQISYYPEDWETIATDPRRHFHAFGFKFAVPASVSQMKTARGEPKDRADVAALRLLDSGSGPLVSVIMPCHNYGRFLPEAFESVMRQNYGSFEVILVDDGSVDETLPIAARLASTAAGRARVIHQPNAGLVAARDAGMRAARGVYAVFFDPDDLLEPTFLAETVAVLFARPEVGFVYTQYRTFGAEERLVEQKDFSEENLRGSCIVTASALFRSDLWRRHKRMDFDPHVIGEDWDFWMACTEAGWIGERIPRPLIRYRRHGLNRTTDTSLGLKALPFLQARHPRLFGEDVAEQARVEIGRRFPHWDGAAWIQPSPAGTEAREVPGVALQLSEVSPAAGAWHLVLCSAVAPDPAAILRLVERGMSITIVDTSLEGSDFPLAAAVPVNRIHAPGAEPVEAWNLGLLMGLGSPVHLFCAGADPDPDDVLGVGLAARHVRVGMAGPSQGSVPGRRVDLNGEVIPLGSLDPAAGLVGLSRESLELCGGFDGSFRSASAAVQDRSNRVRLRGLLEAVVEGNLAPRIEPMGEREGARLEKQVQLQMLGRAPLAIFPKDAYERLRTAVSRNGSDACMALLERMSSFERLQEEADGGIERRWVTENHRVQALELELSTERRRVADLEGRLREAEDRAAAAAGAVKQALEEVGRRERLIEKLRSRIAPLTAR